MQFFKDILSNHIILAPIIAWAVSQILKTVTYLVVEKEFVFKRIISDGGMPSAHSATVISLAGMCGWTQGFDSAAFAIAMILAVVIMRDAVGVRRESGINASAIKLLADRSNKELDAPRICKSLHLTLRLVLKSLHKSFEIKICCCLISSTFSTFHFEYRL